jgi:hypothetical protein
MMLLPIILPIIFLLIAAIFIVLAAKENRKAKRIMDDVGRMRRGEKPIYKGKDWGGAE